jgi:general secretion pathway protein D
MTRIQHTRRSDGPRRRTAPLMVAASALLIEMLLGSCNTAMKPPHIPRPLRAPQALSDTDSTIQQQDIKGAAGTAVSEGLAPPAGRSVAEPYSAGAVPKLTGDNISVTFDGISLPTFINTVFSQILKQSFEIDDTVAKREQLVTMKIVDPVDPNEFFKIVTEVLQNYGISIVYQNNVFRVIESANRRQDLPRIVWSRAVSNVPADQRPVFQFVQLKNVQTAFMTTWLAVALKDRIQIQGVGQVNGLLIMGKSDDVQAALETIEVLDQPHMAGNRSMKIVPQFWTAQKLAAQLQSVLQAEGYNVGMSADPTLAIKLITITELNTIIVFTQANETMAHVLNWARELDRPSETIGALGIFYYQVQNTSAKRLTETLSGLLGSSSSNTADLARRNIASGMGTPGVGAGPPAESSAASTAAALPSGGRVLVDGARNAIIFQGTAEEYSQFRTLAAQMDRAPLEVLIEATIAEVTLNEGEDLGVALTFDDRVSRVPNSTAIESDEGIFVGLVHARGNFLTAINASSNTNKVTILSSPRVVASSGKPATIQVGTQVPIITTQQVDPTGSVGGTSALLQDVQYRNTGVTLRIDPIINSSRKVELAISQEVSEAQANRISSVQSPTIFTRSIDTSLSLNDGETVLLGGLISENFSDGNTGIPFLKDIPIVGNLFKSQSRGRTRIELIILLTPYILDGAEDARAIRDAFKAELVGIPPLPETPLLGPNNEPLPVVAP